MLTAGGKPLVDASNKYLFRFPFLAGLPNGSLDSYKPGTGDDNVALALGATGEFDDTYITQPWVVVHDEMIYLFYGGYDGTNTRIGVATASRSGFTGTNFAKHGEPILDLGSAGAWDDVHAGQPTVIYDAPLWKMWYVGNDGSTAKIGYAPASSPFGPWTKHLSNSIVSPSGWEGLIIAGMSVIREASDSYKMLYHGSDVVTDAAIGLATSADGVSWTKHPSNPVLEKDAGVYWMAKSVFVPRTLVKRNGVYHIYFSGKPTTLTDFSRVGYASSEDLVTWTVQETPLILTGTRAWEGATESPGEIEEPHAVLIDGYWYVYYFCWYGTPKTIGVAIVPES